jgi:putative transposase
MAVVQKSIRIRAYPNGAQERLLNQWFGSARWAWNWALECRQKAYRRRGESITGIGISRRLTRLKKTIRYGWLVNIPATCLVQMLRDQDSAFRHFFRRVKAGETPGYPKFKSRHDQSVSLRFQDVSVAKWARGEVSLPKLGRIKLAESLPGVACPDTVTLKREADGRYYVTFSAEIEVQPLPPTGAMIGVDLGLNHLATLSTGKKIDNPRKYQRRQKYLRQQQRCLARRKPGSKRREKQRQRVARAHAKVRAQRQNALHELTTALVRQYDVICIEDLAVKNMIRNPHLSKQIADAGWGEFRRQLTYKCAWRGRTLVVVDRWYPSSKTCSSCQHKLERLTLNIRGWACPHCGADHDRDHNAAKNLLAEGIASLARVNPGDLRVDGADADAPREARTGQLTNAPSRRRAAVS